MQLVFGRDAILNVKHKANWAYIKSQRDKISCKNNINENKTQRKHEYNVNDKILLQAPTNLKYGTDAYSGLFEITKSNNKRNVKINMGCVEYTYNMRNIKPYYN